MCAGGRASRALYVLYTSPPPLRPGALTGQHAKTRFVQAATAGARTRTLQEPPPAACCLRCDAQDNARRPPCAIHGVIASRSPPASRAGIGAQRTRPRLAAPTHCAFPPAALHPPCSFSACRALPTVCTLLAFPTAHQPHVHAARCALHAQVAWEPLVVARCTLPAARCTRRPRSFGPNPTTRRPPPATRRPLCARASYVPQSIVRTPTRAWYVSTQYGDRDATTYYCVHENNMAGVVRWSGRPAMLSAVEGSCTLCATFTLLQTPSAVATAGARDAPVWTRLKRVLSSERLLPHQRDLRTSCLILGARPLLAGRHQPVAARGSPPAASSSHKMPRATWQPLPASRETRSRSDPSDAAQRSLLQTKQPDC
ncbi:hypothetical protein GGX14DRAFT_581656 [Mycena pura]|uniref:Uncharacterized protein n=1 Tax=Mycena pura TaxID=153505 RepID=A0AAD7E5C0_9AGAR|nr:hypothetical protein GGX14DRAFT_581656 [Mycena pura]